MRIGLGYSVDLLELDTKAIFVVGFLYMTTGLEHPLLECSITSPAGISFTCANISASRFRKMG